MAALAAKHKRWAIEFINPIALQADPKASWRIWHWYKTPELRDQALARLQSQNACGFVFRKKDVWRDAAGRKVYPKKPGEEQS